MSNAAGDLVDWRFEVLNRELAGKAIEVSCTEPILHALFFMLDAK